MSALERVGRRAVGADELNVMIAVSEQATENTGGHSRLLQRRIRSIGPKRLHKEIAVGPSRGQIEMCNGHLVDVAGVREDPRLRIDCAAGDKCVGLAALDEHDVYPFRVRRLALGAEEGECVGECSRVLELAAARNEEELLDRTGLEEDVHPYLTRVEVNRAGT